MYFIFESFRKAVVINLFTTPACFSATDLLLAIISDDTLPCCVDLIY